MANEWLDIEAKTRAGYGYFYLVTPEEDRAAQALMHLAQRRGGSFYDYSAYRGFSPAVEADGSPLECCRSLPPHSVVLLRDYHLELSDPLVMRQCKDLQAELTARNIVIFISATTDIVPQSLRAVFAVVTLSLPDLHELERLFVSLSEGTGQSVSPRHREVFPRAAVGLTHAEATRVFRLVLADETAMSLCDPRSVLTEKQRLVEQEGLLSFVTPDLHLNDVGGLTVLKSWLAEREASFGSRAREEKLPPPKGLLLLGVQGCGKSLTAKALATEWSLPLVRMELGALFSGELSPEERMRRATDVLEAMSPVVLWIDEIEKGFAQTGEGTEGSMQRVFGSFITWLQEKTSPVFVVATANRIEGLPPELLRKGRFDEIFFIDLPDIHERQEILTVHLRRADLVPKSQGSLEQLALQTRNFSGAELEQVVHDGRYRAFSQQRSLTMKDLSDAASALTPLYNTYEEQIKALREWCSSRSRRASADRSVLDLFETESDPQ